MPQPQHRGPTTISGKAALLSLLFVSSAIRHCVYSEDRGYDSPCVLLTDFLPMRSVEGFTVGSILLNDSHYKSLCFKEFDICRRSCFMAGKWHLSRGSVPVCIFARDSHREVRGCHWIGNTTRNFIEVGGRFSSSFPQDAFIREMDARDTSWLFREGGVVCC